MNIKVSCSKCGLGFEISDPNSKDQVKCPGCFSIIENSRSSQPFEITGYKIMEMIGQGGMGQVFKATDAKGNIVAVKVMSQDLLDSEEIQERFKREREIMASLSHENIVKVIDKGETGSFSFLVMEFVEGDTLRNLMRNTTLPEEKVVKIIGETLSALGYAHSKGIIHRDIKPENILFNKEGKVKVTDFGLARKSCVSGDNSPSLTAVNAFLGTESYMSPEQKINPKGVTHKSDIYSLGVVLYEMLTGGNLPMGLFQPPSCYKSVNEFWDNLTFRMLDINPEMRPGNCQILIQEIEAFQAPKKNQKVEPEFQEKETRKKIPAEVASQQADPFQAENARIENALQQIVQEALEKCRQNLFEEGLLLWERALDIVQEGEEKQKILDWIALCRQKISEVKKAPGFTFLCPVCKKTFEKGADEQIKEDFPCPRCYARLKFDPVKRIISPGEDLFAKPKNHLVVENIAKKSDSDPSNQMLNYFIIISVLMGVDFYDAGILNGFAGWMEVSFFSVEKIKEIPTSAEYLRIGIQSLVVILGFGVGYQKFFSRKQ